MKRALLIIDVQKEYFTGALPVSFPENSLPNILAAAEAAHKNSIPIVIIQHTSLHPDAKTFKKGTEGWELHPAIEGMKYDLLIEKTLPGSFTGTGLEAFLKEKEIDTVVISGYMTQMCCDTTARQAFHLGFSVEFLSDATGTLGISNAGGKVTGEELHRAILVSQAMRFSNVIRTSDWINGL